ncbi:DUF637 domain-containing protein, partial [Halomonas qijiaojingensis]|uniref:DUF637 domain-containing protein n=1 Tax=Litchfieldella qijiaojingensis TaxID=980347 RepID=UPI001E631EFB
LPSGSPRKIALHALAGGAVAEATGGDFRTGALAAGANEALVEHLAELVDNDPQLLVVASQITGIVAAELTDGDLSQGAAIAAYSTLYNRGRHPQEEALLAEQAAALEERLGSPQLDGVTWDDMMALVSGAQLDAQQAAQFDALLAGLESTSNANNPQYQRFLHDLQIASVAMDDLTNRYAGLELTWDNGDPITAHGEPVTAFQATDAQYRDSGLFGDTDSGALGLGTLEAIRQYGAAQAGQHQGEIADIGASAPPMDEVYDRAYWNALGGAAKPDTTDVELALTLSGAGAGARAVSLGARGLRNWLQSRVSGGVVARGTRLTYDAASQSWTSPAGLIYGQGSKHGNRVKHVLDHAAPNPNKRTHSVFNVDRNEILGVVDEAWTKRGSPLPNDPGAFIVPMGRVVGTAGETSVKIVVRPNTNEVITAFPVR